MRSRKREFRLTNIISLSNYDVLEMSSQFIRKPYQEWTRRETQQHFEWFLAVKPGRVAEIKKASGVHDATSLDETMALVTEAIRRSLSNLATHVADGQTVNGLGLVVGFDAALIVGDSLVERCSGTSWRVMKTPMRTLISRNLPVVGSDQSKMAFEPIIDGRRVLNLIGRERGREPSNVRGDMYKRWYEVLAPPS